jgi:putative flippase GtrA
MFSIKESTVADREPLIKSYLIRPPYPGYNVKEFSSVEKGVSENTPTLRLNQIALPVRPQDHASGIAVAKAGVRKGEMPAFQVEPLPTLVQQPTSGGHVQATRPGLLRPRRLLGFGLVGGSVMVGGLVLLFLLVHVFGVEEHLAYLIQAVASIETNFFLNRFLNWKERKGNLFFQWIKFHSTSAVTFPVNQVLFAALTALGINYLLVTILGAGVAAVVNYLTNEYFVFHHAHSYARSNAPSSISRQLSQQLWPTIGVVIPVRNSQRMIRQCVGSVLMQDYAGSIEIFLVGNPSNQDMTWEGLGELSGHAAVHCLQVERPYGWTGRDANLKRYCGCKTAAESGIEVIAFLDSQVTAPPDWLQRAVILMQESGVDGIAGRSQRAGNDRSFSSLYQDCSLVSEWPSYGKGFSLDQASFDTAKGLPITNNLLIRRHVWEDIRRHWPMQVTYSWEDFRLVNVIVSAGHTIFCTDALWVERHHQRKFRLSKQFAAGAGAAAFYQDYPDNSYIRRRMQKARLIAAMILLLPVMLIVSLALNEVPVLLGVLGSLCIGLFFLSILSALRARSLRGLLFPFLDFLHIGLWLAGAVYVAGKPEHEREDELASSLLALR